MYPTNEQLEAKWWNRLAKVLIGFIVLVSFVSSIELVIESPKETKFILNTEQSYPEIIKEEKKLKDIDIELRYNLERDILIKLQDTSPEIRKYIEDLRKEIENRPWYEKPVNPEREIYNRVSDTFPNLRIKVWKQFDYLSLLFLLLAPIVYLFLWVLYDKIILYIVYGKKRKG